MNPTLAAALSRDGASQAMIKRAFHRLRRLAGRYGRGRAEIHFYEDARGDGRGAIRVKRWQEIPVVADLRPGDGVLDIGCAEGLIAIEAAKLVREVHGIDILGNRVEAARKFAARAEIANARFSVGSIVADALPEKSYDVVFMLGVYGSPLAGGGRIGVTELAKALAAARRQIVLRVDVQDHPDALTYLEDIYGCFDAHGFDGICFPKVARDVGNIILGSRRNSGARLRYLPPLALIPSSVAATLPITRGQTGLAQDPQIWGGLLGHYPHTDRN